MAAGKYNFTIEQGATTDFEIAYTDSTDAEIDLTDYQARMQIRSVKGASSPLLTLSSSLETDGTGLNMSGSLGINPLTSGTIGVYISAGITEDLNFNTAYYDLEIASGSSDNVYVVRILEGKVKLSKEITKGSY